MELTEKADLYYREAYKREQWVIELKSKVEAESSKVEKYTSDSDRMKQEIGKVLASRADERTARIHRGAAGERQK